MQIAKKNFRIFALYLLLLLTFNVCACYQSKPLHTADASFIDVSVDDILSSDLIPVKIVTDQLSRFFNYTDNEEISLHAPQWTCFNSTDFNSVVRAMGFHRHMMNEYLLSNYLSKEILGFIPKATNVSETIEKRSGKAKNNSYAASDTNLLPSNHKLIEDEGSSQYSTWLKRLNTFEDIQKQLFSRRKQKSDLKIKFSPNRRQSLNINLNPTYKESDIALGWDYLEDGDITGYAFTTNPTERSVPINAHNTHHQSMMDGKSGKAYKQAVSKVGYANSYDDYSGPPHPVHNYASAAPTKQTREVGLKDITDIALTTLAFLSFGMFILQVLMCITMSKEDTSNMVMLPMEGTDNDDIPGDANIEEIRRKRSILSTQVQNIKMIDHLAKRALFSLNAVNSMSHDGGTCLYYSLCENNKFANHLGDLKKLWIPAWSLGISWLTMKFNSSNTRSPSRNETLGINSLRAVIVGLNNGNCSIHYINKCKIPIN